MQTYTRVAKVIGDLAGIDPATIGPAWALGEKPLITVYDRSGNAPVLKLDSLDRITLAMTLEDEFGIAISDREVEDERLAHVGGLVAFVQGKLDAKRPMSVRERVATQLESLGLDPKELLTAAATATAATVATHLVGSTASDPAPILTAAMSVPGYTTPAGFTTEHYYDGTKGPENSGTISIERVDPGFYNYDPQNIYGDCYAEGNRPLTYGDISKTVAERTARDMLDHSADALGYALAYGNGTICAKRSRLSDRWRAFRWWLAGVLEWMAEKVAP